MHVFLRKLPFLYEFKFGSRYGKEVCDAVVAKCLTGRPKTVEKAQAVFLLWIELEAVDAFLVLFFCVFGFISKFFICGCCCFLVGILFFNLV